MSSRVVALMSVRSNGEIIERRVEWQGVTALLRMACTFVPMGSMYGSVLLTAAALHGGLGVLPPRRLSCERRRSGDGALHTYRVALSTHVNGRCVSMPV